MTEPRFSRAWWTDALLRWALRTPGLQRLLGRSTALLTFREQHDGRLVTTPVPYTRDGDRVLITAHIRQHWWRNLAQQPGVHLRLAGVQHHGRARVLQGLEALDAYLTYLGAHPMTARAAGIDLHDGEPDPRQAQAELVNTRVVAIDLVPLVTSLSITLSDRG